MLARMPQQRLSKSNDGIGAPHPALSEEQLDPATAFLYKPHTITAGAFGLAALLYFSRTFQPSAAPSEPGMLEQQSYRNAYAGVWAVILTYLGYSVVQGPVTCMVRPHPAVWRLIHGVLLVYFLFCIFLLFQDVNGARQFLRHLFPDLGVDPNERSYGADCRLWLPDKRQINWKPIKETLFDEFVVAHTLGWWCKALILRDYTLLWALSIGFELMELTFQHMLPNFNECWWDSWILDVAVCNFIGIYTGMQTVKWARAQDYNWTGLSSHRTLTSKAKRSLLQFTPYSWDTLEWRAFSTPQRCLQATGLLMIFLVMEVNAFFLKYVLWIPPLNPLNTLRLLVLFLAALPTVKEYYAFIDQPSGTRKLGFFAWLYAALAVVETAIVVKFGRGMFPKPWPSRVLWFWGSVLSIYVSVMGVWLLKIRQQSTSSKHKKDL